jgi:hypothetical protein
MNKEDRKMDRPDIKIEGEGCKVIVSCGEKSKRVACKGDTIIDAIIKVSGCPEVYAAGIYLTWLRTRVT